MKIEKLLPPAQPGKSWTVALEGGDTLRVPEGTILDYALYDGRELAEEELAELKAAAFSAALRTKAVHMLSSRLMSAGQLNEKLMAKGATDRQAAEIVAWAIDIGLLNDEEYAKALARHYQAKGYGIYKIKDELYRRRVPRQYWEGALADLEDPEEIIDACLAKKVKDPADRKEIKKASDALVRRGFSWSQVAAGGERLKKF